MSAIEFKEARTGRRVDALADAEIHVSSSKLGWNGLLVESGCSNGWDVTDLAPEHHYIAVHLGREPMDVEFGSGDRPRPRLLAPGAVWINPSDHGSSWRVREPMPYVALTLDPDLSKRLLGSEGLDLREPSVVDAPVIRHLVLSLLAEAKQGGPTGPSFAQTVGAALTTYLDRHHSARPVSAEAGPGRLSREQLSRALDFVEAHLSTGPTLEEMSEAVMLSPSHFARAFKATVGTSPYAYLMQRRLERARDLLLAGSHRVGEVAAELGFADAPHLSRQFKAHFGTPPSQFRP